MRGNCSRFLLNLIIMLAFIGAGVSPACKFISGQSSLVEICGVDGIRTVRVSAEQLPPSAPEHHKHAKDACAFCFAGAHFKTASAAPVFITVPSPVYVAAQTYPETRLTYNTYPCATLPRGPPSFV